MINQKIVIIGAGLGGSFLAASLVDYFDVIMIDICDLPPSYKDRLYDLGKPAITYPTIDSGKGGTSKLWHNALMEIDSKVFDSCWPFPKSELDIYYDKAYLSLIGTSKIEIIKKSSHLKNKLKKIGFIDKYLTQTMVFPKKRINAFYSNNLNSKIKFYKGEVVSFNVNDDKSTIESLVVKIEDNVNIGIKGDIYVLCAGGIGTPVLLQALSQKIYNKYLSNAGKNYEDHLMAYVGEIELSRPLYKLINYPVLFNRKKGYIRIPVSLFFDNIQISIQFRPAYQLKTAKPREKVKSMITSMRNNPLQPKNYLNIISNLDDFIEILSFAFGLHFPTKKYTLLLVTQHPSVKDLAIWNDVQSKKIIRNWKIENDFLDSLNDSIAKIIHDLGDMVIAYNMFPKWRENLFSASHHSGTAKMGKESENCVCDLNGKVFGVDNLYISDGSTLPGSGCANTGLTIVALSYRLSDYLKKLFKN